MMYALERCGKSHRYCTLSAEHHCTTLATGGCENSRILEAVKTPEIRVLPFETPSMRLVSRPLAANSGSCIRDPKSLVAQMDKEALNADPSMAPAPAKKAKKIKSVSTFDPSKDALKHVSTPLRKKIWQVKFQALHPEP
jgi:hypothetical protein